MHICLPLKGPENNARERGTTLDGLELNGLVALESC